MITINKKKLVLDFDGCIINTIKKITEIYDSDFSTQVNYKKVRWTQINTWNFEELSLASKKHIDDYFNQKRFFDNLEFMENAKEIISMLSLDYEIVICTMGTKENLRLKQEWIEKNLPCCDEFIGVDLTKYKNKAHIDMTGSIFIDDVSKNLVTSNADIKILYGDDYVWNTDWKGNRCYNWTEIIKRLKR